jgi:hypothetical protein
MVLKWVGGEEELILVYYWLARPRKSRSQTDLAEEEEKYCRHSHSHLIYQIKSKVKQKSTELRARKRKYNVLTAIDNTPKLLSCNKKRSRKLTLGCRTYNFSTVGAGKEEKRKIELQT